MTRLNSLAEDLWREASHAVRGLRRTPGFAAIAIATIATGVGASAAIFTLVDTVVFRSLPYEDPARLVEIFDTQPGLPPDDVSWADFLDIAAQQDLFAHVGADDGGASAFASAMARSRRPAARRSPRRAASRMTRGQQNGALDRAVTPSAAKAP